MISFGWIGVGLPCREGVKTDWIAQSISARMGIELKKEAIGKRNQIEARQNDPAHVSVCPAVFRSAPIPHHHLPFTVSFRLTRIKRSCPALLRPRLLARFDRAASVGSRATRRRAAPTVNHQRIGVGLHHYRLSPTARQHDANAQPPARFDALGKPSRRSPKRPVRRFRISGHQSMYILAIP